MGSFTCTKCGAEVAVKIKLDEHGKETDSTAWCYGCKKFIPADWHEFGTGEIYGRMLGTSGGKFRILTARTPVPQDRSK